MKKYIVKLRSNVTHYYMEHAEHNLLIKCNAQWEPINKTGWSYQQLKNMHYVRSITEVQTHEQN